MGSFPLLSGSAESSAGYERVATLLVSDIESAGQAVASHCGEVLGGPAVAPHRPRMIAPHGDGSVFE